MATALQRSLLPPTGDFSGIFGWKHVEAGVEAWVCDGKVIDVTSVARDLRRIIGHKQFVRRVLLHPDRSELKRQARPRICSTSRSPPPSPTGLLTPFTRPP